MATAMAQVHGEGGEVRGWVGDEFETQLMYLLMEISHGPQGSLDTYSHLTFPMPVHFILCNYTFSCPTIFLVILISLFP